MKISIKKIFVSAVALLTFCVANAASSDVISSVTCSGTTFTIKRNTTTYPTTVYYRTVNGSAVGGIHFQEKSGEVTFAAGESEKTITITLMTPTNSSVDAYEEYDRNFYFEVWNSCTSPIITSCWYGKNNYVTKYSMYELSKSYSFSQTTMNKNFTENSVAISSFITQFDPNRKAYLNAVGQPYKYLVRAILKFTSGTTSGNVGVVQLHQGTSGTLANNNTKPTSSGSYNAVFKFTTTSSTPNSLWFPAPYSGNVSSAISNVWSNGIATLSSQYFYYPSEQYYSNYTYWVIMPSTISNVGIQAFSTEGSFKYTPTIELALKDEAYPHLVSINTNAEKIYTSGEKIYISLRFEEIVKVKSTNFTIPISIGGTEYNFKYEIGTGTNTLVFSASPTITSPTYVSGMVTQMWPESSCENITDMSGNISSIYYTSGNIKIGQKYTVSYYTNGGTINCGEIKYYTYSVGATLPTNVTRTGYTFGGWYTNSSFTGSPVTTISTTDTGNKTYYAKWTANKYLVTLDNRSANSSGTASVYATYGSLMPTIVPPIKTGYTFGGYFDDTDGQGTQYYYASGSGYRYSYLTAPITLYAKWTIKKPTITFNNQSATTAGTTSATATYGSAMPSITKPTKTGYTFGGYFTAVNGGGTQYYLASGASAQSCDFETAQTLYAKWTANTYTITFDNQSATSAGTKTATATYNEKLPEIIAPTKTGYTFQGYYLGSNGSSTKYYNADGSANQSLFLRTAATTLYAYWVKDTYTITYVNNGGTVSTTPKTTYQYGDATITLPSISRDGCTFGGWYDNANCEGTAITTIPNGSLGNKTFYAKWTPNTYTVNLNLVGGSIKSGNITSYVYGVGAILPLSSVMTKSGFGFAGWYDNEDYDGDAVSEITIADFGNKEYWAKWEEGSYPVVLNTNEGVVNTGNVVSYKHGTAKTLPTDVTRTGYIFEGWFDNSSCLGTPVTEISAEAVDEKVFWAKWREQVYNVTFETNEGTINNEVVINNYTFSVGGTLPSNVTRNGYSFMGWFDNPDFAGNSVALIRSSDYGNKTYYAKWNKNVYSIAYFVNGGDIYDEEIVRSYTIDDEFELPSEVYKNGYTFYGWYDNPNFDNDPIDYVESDDFGNKTFYAKWVVKSYNITLVVNNGTINSGNVSKYTYGYGATLPVDVTRTGYTFAGWYSDASFTSNRYLSIAEDETGSKTFYAKWTENTYSITMNVNDGNIKSENVSSYTYGTSVTLPTNVVRDGYTFGGWYENSNFDGAPVKTVSSTSVGNKTYYAKWVVNSYSVVLDADGGQINAGLVTSYTYGVGAILPTNVTKVGYTFEGWADCSGSSRYKAILKSAGANKLQVVKKVKEMLGLGLKDAKDLVDSAPRVLEEDITLEAAQIYKESIEALGGEVVIEGIGRVGNGTILAAISSETIGDIELVARWNQNEYLITYNANGGSFAETPTTNYVYGDEVTLPTPVNTGYIFGGWFSNSNFSGSPITEISDMETGSKEFWAKWDVNTYAVTLNVNGGEINSGNITNYTYNVLSILPQDVTKVGYTFEGWFDNEECEGTAITQISKGTIADKEFWAKWSARTYVVTLQTNNGTVNEGNVTSYTYGVGATLPTNVTKTGCNFVGWYDNSSYDGGVVTKIANDEIGNKNFWAKWTSASYTVTLNANGGSINSNNVTSYTYGVGAILPTDVTKEGYIFNGWKDAENNDALEIATNATGNKTYTASWTKATYTITYNANGGTINSAYAPTYQLGVATTLPTNVTKAGCTFAGWYDNANLTGAKVTAIANTAVGNKNFYAAWTANNYTVTLTTNGGTVNSGNINSYTYGVTASLPTNVTKEGYTFTGWYTNSACTGSVVSIISSTTTGNQTFYAGWSNTAYAVTLNTNNGVISEGNVTSYVYGTAKALPSAQQVSKTGYTFGGWYNNSSCTGTAQTAISATATGDKEFWAKWTVNSYTVSLTTNGGTINSGNVTKYTFGVGATLPTDVTKTGYTFAGWYDNEELSGTAVDRVDEYAIGNKAFHAKWTAKDYTIVYETSAGTIDDADYADSYTYGVGTTLPTNVTKTGCTFAGWYTNSSYEGVPVTKVSEFDFGNKTFYAKWNSKVYDVTLNTNEGTVNSGAITSYAFGVGATLPTSVSKVGYTFAGWYDNAEFAGESVATIPTNATNAKEFWAKWSVNSYDVTFYANGGIINAGNISEYEFGTGANLPTNVTKEGYEFAGWFDNSSLAGSAVTTIATNATGNKSFWAAWSLVSYDVVLNAKGGTINSGNVTTYKHSVGATLPTDVTKTGYTFAGWFANEACSGESVATIGTDATGNQTFYAKWTVNSYDIVLNANAGTINSGNVAKYEFGVGAILPTDVTKTGYNFAGWFDNSNLNGERVSSVSETDFGNKNFYAKWNVCTYAVTLNANGGTVNSGNVVAYTYNNGATLPIDVTRTGYTFVGWYESEALSGDAVLSIPLDAYGDKTYHAKWTANTYSVELVTNDGTINNGNVTSYTYGVGATLPIDVTKDGYNFEGWFNNSNYDTEVSAISATDFGYKTYYAKWSAQSYAIAYETNGGTINGTAANSYTFGVGAILPTDVKKSGYNFAGWYTNSGFSGDAVLSVGTNVSENQTFYAKWTTASYTIAFNNNGGEINDAEYATEYTFGTSVTLPSDVTKTGYTFVGWFDNVNLIGEAATEVSATDFGNKTFYAKWSVDSYTITLNVNDGTINAGNVSFYIYGNGATLPSDVTKVGNTFEGWYENADFSDTQVISIDESATGNKTYYAKWAANTYAVTLIVNDGTINSGAITTYTFGEGATLPTDVTKPGYDFAGWYNNSNYDVKETAIANNDFGAKTFYAKWSVKSFAVTLNTNGGVINANNVESYTFGEGAILPTNVTKDGYEFAGWFDNDEFSGTAVVEITTTANGDKEFFANWTEGSYTIAFDNNGGTINDVNYATGYTFGETVTLPTDVTREGYEFADWFNNVNLEGSVVTNVAASEYGNKTFYAAWTPNKYGITFETNEGTINAGAISEYTYGVTTSLPTNVTKEGFTFMGWYADEECEGDVVSIVASNEIGAKKYFAKWATNSYSVVLNTNNGIISAGNVTGYTFGVGATLPTAEQISKTGNTFVGWYDNSSCEGTIVTEIPAESTGNLNFWAKWAVNSYDITLNANGGTITSGNVVFYTYGNGATLPSDVTKAGYTFAGWFESEDLDGERVVRIDETTIGNQTFHAKWTENTYNIVFVVNEGTINDETYATEYTYGVGAALPTSITRTGYDFGGWYANSNYDGSAVTAVADNEYGEKTYYAKWSVNSYSVTLNANGGEINNGNILSYTYGVGATLPTDVTKTGYTLAGWYDNEEFGNEPYTTITTDMTGNKTFWAKWQINTYSVELFANGGEINSGNVESYEYKQGATLPTDITRKGYKFAGWFNNSSLTGERYYEINQNDLGNKSYFAKWEVEMFDVVLNTNGGTINSGNITSYSYSNGTILPNNVTKTGNTFAGWFDNENLEGNAITTIPFDAFGAKEYWAKWSANNYDVVFIVNEGTIQEGMIEDYVYGIGAILPTNVTKNGCTFGGWYTNSNYDGAATSIIGDKEYGDKTFYAKWYAETFSVNFETNGGTINAGNVTSYTFGVAATLPTNVTKIGYQFVGWFDNENLEGDAIALIANDENGAKTYYAKWNVQTYNVSLNANGGVINDNEITSYEYGSTKNLPDNVTRDGYEFAGWFDNPNLTGERILTINPKDLGNKTYFAKWSVQSFKITLVENGGTINSGNIVAYTYSNGATLPIDVTKAGNTFAGWFDNENFEGEAILSIPLDAYGDKSYYAKWIENEYSITYFVNEGSIDQKYPTTYKFGTNTILPDTLSREGYTFVGWYNTSNFDGVAIKSIDSKDYGNKLLYARWTVNAYKVAAEYDKSMGSVEGTGLYNYNTNATLTAKADAGYEFVNWNIGDNANIETASNTTLQDSLIQIIVKDNISLTANFKVKESVYATNKLIIDTLQTNKEAQPIDLTGLFASSENGEISYSVASSAPNVVLAQLNDGKLFLSTFAYAGESDITITAKLANGKKATISAKAIVEYDCNIHVEAAIQNASCFGLAGGKITLSANEGSNYNYQWINTEITSNELSNIEAGNYQVLITDENGCKSYETFTITQPSEMIVTIDSVINPSCNNESQIKLSANGNYNYLWSNGATEKDLIGAEIGIYEVTVTNAETGCSIKVSQSLNLSFKQPEISMITISRETGNNLIVWEREITDQIEYYTIYRESDIDGEYDSIATVNYTEISVYEDTDKNVNPNERSWSYKISATDKCGNKTALSQKHKTLHLGQTESLRADKAELFWEKYEGIDYKSYYVIRETTVKGYTMIDTVTTLPANIETYTANIPQFGKSIFYVGIKTEQEINPKDFLKVETGPFTMALSNIAEAKMMDEPEDDDIDENNAISITVNNGSVVIENANDAEVEIFDNLGRLVKKGNSQIFDLNQGLYIVKVGSLTQKIVVE